MNYFFQINTTGVPFYRTDAIRLCPGGGAGVTRSVRTPHAAATTILSVTRPAPARGHKSRFVWKFRTIGPGTIIVITIVGSPRPPPYEIPAGRHGPPYQFFRKRFWPGRAMTHRENWKAPGRGPSVMYNQDESTLYISDPCIIIAVPEGAGINSFPDCVVCVAAGAIIHTPRKKREERRTARRGIRIAAVLH